MAADRLVVGATGGPGEDIDGTAGALDAVEVKQLSRLRRWGTVGALLLMLGAGSSYGAATPIPNPVDGLRILGLLSRNVALNAVDARSKETHAMEKPVENA